MQASPLAGDAASFLSPSAEMMDAVFAELQQQQIQHHVGISGHFGVDASHVSRGRGPIGGLSADTIRNFMASPPKQVRS